MTVWRRLHPTCRRVVTPPLIETETAFDRKPFREPDLIRKEKTDIRRGTMLVAFLADTVRYIGEPGRILRTIQTFQPGTIADGSSRFVPPRVML